VQVLGDFRVAVRTRGGALVRLLGARGPAPSLELDLVYALALAPAPLADDELAALLWPGAAERWAQRRLGELHRGLDRIGGRSAVRRDQGHFWLEPERVDCDWWQVRARLARIEQAVALGDEDGARAEAAAALEADPRLLSTTVAEPQVAALRGLWLGAQERLGSGQAHLRRLAGLPV
jgi:hypothetical protein